MVTNVGRVGFEYVGFVPSQSVLDWASAGLGRIFGESPSDSSTIAQLVKTATGFQGHLQIRSAVGEFVADVIGDDPIQVISALSNRVHKQLLEWKSGRALNTDLF